MVSPSLRGVILPSLHLRCNKIVTLNTSIAIHCICTYLTYVYEYIVSFIFRLMIMVIEAGSGSNLKLNIE